MACYNQVDVCFILSRASATPSEPGVLNAGLDINSVLDGNSSFKVLKVVPYVITVAAVVAVVFCRASAMNKSENLYCCPKLFTLISSRASILCARILRFAFISLSDSNSFVR